MQANIGNKIFTLIAHNDGRWMHTHLAMFQAKPSPLSVHRLLVRCMQMDLHIEPQMVTRKFFLPRWQQAACSCSARLNSSKPKLTSSTNYNTITGIVVVGTRSYMAYDNDKAYPTYLIKYSTWKLGSYSGTSTAYLHFHTELSVNIHLYLHCAPYRNCLLLQCMVILNALATTCNPNRVYYCHESFIDPNQI